MNLKERGITVGDLVIVLIIITSTILIKSFSKDKNFKNIKNFTDTQKLPLPNIKNLRKWINNDKKAS